MVMFAMINLERKISNYEFPFLSLGALVHQKIEKGKECHISMKHKLLIKQEKIYDIVLTKKKR